MPKRSTNPAPDFQIPDIWPGDKLGGVQLLTATSGVPLNKRRIRWVREADGSLAAEVFSFDLAGFAEAGLRAVPEGADSARTRLETVLQDGFTPGAGLYTQYAGTDALSKVVAYVKRHGGATREAVVIDGAEASDFLQLANRDKVTLDFGIGLVGVIAAGATADLIVPHALGVTPNIALGSATESRLTVASQSYTAADVTFRLRNVSLAASVAAAVFWLAIG